MSRFQYLRRAITLSLTRKTLLSAIGLATVMLMFGYLLGQLWLETPVVFLAGLLWVVCALRDLRWAASPLFMLMLIAAAIGYMARLSHILMLASACVIVLAWDLHHFEARLLDVDDPSTQEMERNHLQRVVLVSAGSFLLVAIDSFLQIRFRFIVLVMVTILAIVILNQVMLIVRKPGSRTPPKP